MLWDEEGEIFFNGLLSVEGEGDLLLQEGEGDLLCLSIMGGEGDLLLLGECDLLILL